MTKKKPHSRGKPISAADFAKQMQSNPEYIARVEQSEKRRQEQMQEEQLAAAPIVEELRRAGYPLVRSPWELRDLFIRTREPYIDAVPILVSWLPRISNAEVKDTIIRLLSVPWARDSASVLISEFRKGPLTPTKGTTWKWTIGNALSVVADDSVFSEVVELVRDKSHGRDREMLALALANMRNKSAVEVLIQLLEDEQVAGHAVVALGKIGAVKAVPYLEKFTSHPKTWIRNEAKKALSRIEAGPR